MNGAMHGPVATGTPVVLAEAVAGGLAPGRGAATTATVHALFWLCFGNAVGVLLSTLLLVPGLGASLGPFSYGRWIPVHFDAQLYGWSALPLVALLFYSLLPQRPGLSGGWVGKVAQIAIVVWSFALGLGVLSWLNGGSSGKLFLEWAGAARWALALALAFLEVVLVAGYLARFREGHENKLQIGCKATLLALLAVVPILLFWSASPEVYPPVNPDSGGSTGTSLLGSSLGIVVLLVALPLLLGIKALEDRWRLVLGQTSAALLAHFALFSVIGHGGESHYQLGQILALASLVIWWPLAARWLACFEWTPVAQVWLKALGWWSAVLLVSAVIMFLPGVLDRLKFTNALVAHAHLAMAGVITSLNFLIIGTISGRSGNGPALNRFSFWLWHGGCAAFLVSLTVLGGLEAQDPGRLFRPDLASTVLYTARLFAGLAMLVASGIWLRDAVSIDAADGGRA